MNPSAGEFIPRGFYTSIQSRILYPSQGYIQGPVSHSSPMDLTPDPFLNMSRQISTSSNPITQNLLKMACLYKELQCEDWEKKSSSNGSSGYETSSPFLPTQNSTSPNSIILQKQFSFDRKDTEDFELEEMSQMFSKPKKSVREDYICHICHLQGDHIIQHCPKKERQNELRGVNTPYQGSKMCLGQFLCPKCKRKWSSTKSEAGIGQDCTKCKINTLPYKQMSLSVASKRGLVIGFDPQFPHLCRVVNSRRGASFPAMEHWN